MNKIIMNKGGNGGGAANGCSTNENPSGPNPSEHD